MRNLHKLRHLVMIVVSSWLFPPQLVFAAPDLQRAADNFQTNCAGCHGAEGRLDPEGAVVKSLGVTPVNFSDALFNSREPASLWELVVTHGGHSIGLSDKMPAFKDVLSAEEISELMAYVKTLGGEHNYPDGELNLLLPLKTMKAFPEDEVVWKTRFTDKDSGDQWKNTLEIEKRFGYRFQGVLELNHLVENNEDRFESLEFGGKYVLISDLRRRLIASIGSNLKIPLDSDINSEILPYVAIGHIINDQFTFQGSTRAKLPMRDIEKGGVELSAIVHWTHTPWPRSVFPGLELTAEVPLDRGSGSSRSDFARVSLTPQVRIGLSRLGHVAFNVGVEVPLNETDRFDYRGYLYLIWDFADGAFWKGW